MNHPTDGKTLVCQLGRYRTDRTVTQETRVSVTDLVLIRNGQLKEPKRRKQRDALSRLWWDLYGADVTDQGESWERKRAG